MHQPKTLFELAREEINRNIEFRPHLRDLALPSRMIRELDESYVHDHLMFERWLWNCKSICNFYGALYGVKLEKPPRYITSLQLAALMNFPEEEEGAPAPVGRYCQTVIND